MKRRRNYKTRRRALGLCQYCSRLPIVSGRCARHALSYRRRERRRLGISEWQPGRVGRPPRYTDAALREIVRREDEGGG